MYLPLKPSLLDNLIDESPESSVEQPQPYTLKALKKSVRRDLENLLNSRVCWHLWPKHYSELNVSVLNYGLPDFSALPFSRTEGQVHLCNLVEETIKRFEPRFDSICVSVIGEGEPEDRILRLRIQAIFRVGSAEEEIVFDSEVEPISLGIKVEES